MSHRRTPSGTHIAGKRQGRTASGAVELSFAECDATATPRCREGFRTLFVSHTQCLDEVLDHTISLADTPRDSGCTDSLLRQAC